MERTLNNPSRPGCSRSIHPMLFLKWRKEKADKGKVGCTSTEADFLWIYTPKSDCKHANKCCSYWSHSCCNLQPCRRPASAAFNQISIILYILLHISSFAVLNRLWHVKLCCCHHVKPSAGRRFMFRRFTAWPTQVGGNLWSQCVTTRQWLLSWLCVRCSGVCNCFSGKMISALPPLGYSGLQVPDWYSTPDLIGYSGSLTLHGKILSTMFHIHIEGQHWRYVAQPNS